MAPLRACFAIFKVVKVDIAKLDGALEGVRD